MSTLLLKNAELLVTMDGERREIAGGGIFVRDGWIEQVAESSKLPQHADRIADMTGCVVFPGLVNTHHHLFQTLDRANPASENLDLVGWLRSVYPRWERMTPDDIRLAAEIGLAELALSGCTTVADHHYLWPNGNRAEDQIEVAQRLGLRFHLGRGFQNIGRENGGFAPPSLLEEEDAVFSDCERLIAKYHDPAPGARLRIFVAPSSLRSVTPEVLRNSAELSRRHGVGFHMHLGETAGEIEFARERFGCRPLEIAEAFGCIGDSSWYAHGVHFDEEDVSRLKQHQCGICHCPSSNMVVGSGVAQVQRYKDAGLKIGLGVDGAATNDSSNLLAEMRLALLLSRVSGSARGLTTREALELATLGGACVLGRADIGRLQAGCAADLAAVPLDRLELLGINDPVAALSLCAIGRVDHSFVHGESLVEDGVLARVEVEALARRARAYSAQFHA